jgi:hypothetical protein
MRDGSVLRGWPGGRRRAQDGPRSMLVDQKFGTRKPRSASRSRALFDPTSRFAVRLEPPGT